MDISLLRIRVSNRSALPNSCTSHSLAKDLIKRLCSVQVSRRYDAKVALEHPWITRNFKDEVPWNFDTEIQQIKHEQMLHKCIRFVTFLSIVQNGSLIIENTRDKASKEYEEYK